MGAQAAEYLSFLNIMQLQLSLGPTKRYAGGEGGAPGVTRFTYHKKATALRTHMQMLLMVAGFELVAWAVAIPLLPRPWNLVLLGLVVIVSALILPELFRVTRTRHRLDHSGLTFAYGKNGLFGTWALRLALAEISGAGLFSAALPRGLAPGLLPVYRADDDTLYLLADRKGLVVIALKQPVESRLSEQGTVQFTRLVITLDEPQAFLDAVADAGAEVEPPMRESAAPGPALRQPRLTPPIAPTPGAAILLNGLSRRFGGFTAVHPISLSVAPGEVLAFLGSNGAGKTTTIKMMTGLLRPTSGQVLINGRDVWREGPGARRLFGYVPDIPLLYEGLTPREFLWLMAGLYDLPRADGRRRTEELLGFLRMERWGDHLIRQFSLGMKRKMAIAAALMHQPQVLLLDEVTNGLDPRASREVKDLIAGAARAGAAIFLTTHLLDVAQELAHRIAIIHRGELRALGTLAELRAQTGLVGANLEELFLALTAEPLRAEVKA